MSYALSLASPDQIAESGANQDNGGCSSHYVLGEFEQTFMSVCTQHPPTHNTHTIYTYDAHGTHTAPTARTQCTHIASNCVSCAGIRSERLAAAPCVWSDPGARRESPRLASQQKFFGPTGPTYRATANVVLSEAEDAGRVPAGSLSQTAVT